jgi:hypothetical protein
MRMRYQQGRLPDSHCASIDDLLRWVINDSFRGQAHIMLRNLILPFGLAAILLTGCGPSSPQAKPTAAPTTDYLAKINQLAPKQRDATFYRAIQDAGFICDNVSTSQAQQAVDGHPAWDARCSDGGHWTLVLFDNGILQVLKAAASTGGSTAAPANKM